ncbi:lipopolysaccharide transport periplasmic protein LptA [Histidinibacterium aquaticum]|uniref:Lipopolysaccharide transport periplasmic protein LptA n=1 Tax=Histidinibacterium aquaticum TaxID=2613962 RepID=A0A5J5GFS1_9RHOB|nr:lipopolysaccharide transport periplasmic protein LptA [Histidinibacterium aquaticum]KAA9006937.1 lipopolysaccharide transport periplasmic protein LptA [Histidinibacterium aquaticum]
MRFFAALAFSLLALPAAAQTNIDLGGLSAEPDAPVEVTADTLNVDRDSGTAVFTGNVVVGQGSLRLAAAEVEVVYDEETGDIARFAASGGVTLVTETEEAEAEEATYDLTTGELSLSGDVLLTQGQSALSAETMTVNVETGMAQMQGRVRTVFQQDGE